MPRGRGIKRSLGGRGGIANRGGGSSQHLLNTSQNNISEPSTHTSHQVDSIQRGVSSHESGSQHVHSSEDIGAQQRTLAPQDVGAQQEHSSQDVSSEQPTHASCESNNPRARRATVRGKRPLEVNGDTFCPHDAVRMVTLAFKKNFSGSWHCWSKVPEYKRDQWFNDFEKNFSFPDEDRVLIRKTFDRVGSDRLSDTLGKAKRKFSVTKTIPTWIRQHDWDGLMNYWNSDEFKKISAINYNNRMSSNNGEGPSLHTGGSVSFAEYRRRHKEQTGQDLRDDELFLKTHKTKDKEWIYGKSQRVWNTFTDSIKKVGETSTSRNQEDYEADDGDMERDIATNEDEEEEQDSEENFKNLLQNIPEEQLVNAWIEAVGGVKKGRVYGLGTGSSLLGDKLHVHCESSRAPTSTSVPIQQLFESPEFEQLLDRVLEKRMMNVQANIQESVRASMTEDVGDAVRAVVGRMLGLSPQPPQNGAR